jgi:hypothetical protein
MLERAMQVWGDSQAAGLVPDCRLCITYIEVATKLDMTEQALNMYRQVGGWVEGCVCTAYYAVV